MHLLLYSKERLALALAQKKLKERFLKSYANGEVESIDCEESSLGKLKEALLLTPLFSERRLIFLKNGFKAFGEKSFFQFYETLPQATSLVFLEESPKLELKLEHPLKIKRVSLLSKEELAVIESELIKAGFSLYQRREILKLIEKDQWFIFNEAAKIRLAKKAGVAAAEILSIPAWGDIFKLADAWLFGDKERLAQLLVQLSDKPPEEMLGGLVYALRQLILFSEGGRQAFPQLPDFVFNLRKKCLKYRGREWLFFSYLKLAELDYKLKTGQQEKETLTFFLLKSV